MDTSTEITEEQILLIRFIMVALSRVYFAFNPLSKIRKAISRDFRS